MKFGLIICYTLGSKATAVQRNRFRKEFLGYIDHSNHGRFTYRRKGILDEIPHVKLIRSVVIIREEDRGKVVQCLEKHGAGYYIRRVELTSEDGYVLGERG